MHHQLELQSFHVHHKSLDNIPLYIPRYLYQSSQQFSEVFQIECRRYEELNCAVIRRYHSLEPEDNSTHHGIYLRYRDRLQSLERRFGYTWLPATWIKFSGNAYRLSFRSDSHKSQKDYLQFLCYNPTPYFLFIIDQSRFKKDFFTSNNTLLRFRFFQQNTLLAMVPLPEHGLAAGELAGDIHTWIVEMKLRSHIRQWLGSGVSAKDDKSEQRVPDYAMGPKRPPSGHSKDRPTLVVEIGRTQSLPSLGEDGRWWLNPTKGDANICITCKLDRTPRLVIDVWERNIPKGRDGDKDDITRAQHLIITKNKKTDDIVVRGAPMIIKFSHLMGRNPDESSTKEKDLVIEEERLKEIAISIWEEEGLIDRKD